MLDEIKVTVDRASFFDFARVFQRNRRNFLATNVVLRLGDGQLRIECYDGGCALPCECPQPLVAELTAKAFANVAIDHRNEKSNEKTIQLTFRPELGEFATPITGVKAKITIPK